MLTETGRQDHEAKDLCADLQIRVSHDPYMILTKEFLVKFQILRALNKTKTKNKNKYFDDI